MNSVSCPSCCSVKIKKSGIRANKFNKIQRYQCKDCNGLFIISPSKNKTYPTHSVLASVSLYNLGYPQSEIPAILSKKFKIRPSQKTISNWIREYKPICTFSKLRKQALSISSPEEMTEQYEFLHNNLPYIYQIHKAKLELLFKEPYKNDKKLKQPISDYLNKIPTKEFSHHIFKKYLHNVAKEEQRASEIGFQTLPFIRAEKQNLAIKLAYLALSLAKTNTQRHKAIQDFFIVNDSTTIATEIPVYLTQDDITYFISKRFNLSQFTNFKTPITGHIDLLQIRNNIIHILDYKPGAEKEYPIHQLTIYALALASRTKLPLSSFKCAWFDEHYYFEFFPLHAVYKNKNQQF